MIDKVTLGIGIGVAIGLAGCYVVYRYSKSKNTTSMKKNLKSSGELISQKEHIATFTSENMINWFHENKGSFDDSIKMVVATPTKEALEGLGYTIDAKLNAKQNILQFFYDDKSSVALKIRLVEYDNIDSNLQAHLLDNDGLIVISD